MFSIAHIAISVCVFDEAFVPNGADKRSEYLFGSLTQRRKSHADSLQIRHTINPESLETHEEYTMSLSW